MNSTYAFVLSTDTDWRLSSADDWSLDVISLEGNEKILGHKKIDGAICKVILINDGKIAAVTKVN